MSIFLNSQVPKFYWFLVLVYDILNTGIEDIIKTYNLQSFVIFVKKVVFEQ